MDKIDRYLFRGQRKDSKQFYYGGYHSWNGNHFIVETGKNGNLYDIEVIPETVGQYTGLTDKNGVRIFEHDVLGLQFDSVKYIVSFEDGCFVLRHTKLKDCDGSMYKWGTLARAFEIENFPLEVIGTIHDNQEVAA